MACGQGQVCVPKTGACTTDPCATTRCGVCSLCTVTFNGAPACAADNTCISGGRVQASAPGCACALGTTPAPGGGPAAAAFLLLAMLGLRRRRGGRR
jgi:MYXO-CTERM domain-containing protein